MRRGLPAAILAAALVALLTGAVQAAPFQTLRVPASHQTWTLDFESGRETTVTQTFLPVTLVRTLGPRGHMVVSATMAASGTDHNILQFPQLTDEGLTGLSDLKILGVYRLGESFLVQGGVNLPTGATELSLEEFYVVRNLAHPLLGFPLRQYGQGWGVSGGVAWAGRVSPRTEVGLGVGGLYHGDYHLLKDVYETYQPGYELAASGGLTIHGESAARLNLDLIYRTFGKDTVDDETVYLQGDQLETHLRFKPQLGERWLADIGARTVIKSDAEINTGGETVGEILSAPGNSFHFGLDVLRLFSPSTGFGLNGMFRSYSGSETDRQDGTTMGVGPSLALFSDSSSWRFFVTYQWGEFKANDAFTRADLSGWSAGVNLQWED